MSLIPGISILINLIWIPALQLSLMQSPDASPHEIGWSSPESQPEAIESALQALLYHLGYSLVSPRNLSQCV